MAGNPPKPAMNPITGPTVDTKPSALGLLAADPELTPVERTPNIVKRTVNKLRGNISPTRDTGHRRIPSLKKDKNMDGREPTSEAADIDLDLIDDITLSKHSHSVEGTLDESSPFGRPASPEYPIRPSLDQFRGIGTMRAGTQTLIQALQAMPWNDDRERDEDVLDQGLESVHERIESDEDTNHKDFHLASSIHTIHRPVARYKRGVTPMASQIDPCDTSPSGAYFSGALSSEDEFPGAHEDDEDDEDDEDGDFEVTHPGSHGMHGRVSASEKSLASTTIAEFLGPNSTRTNMIRSTSMATVRLQRRARLAEKLREVFGLRDIDEVVAEMPCWLLRSILLQGYMYLTNAHLCFFAHLPAREDQVLKSGHLSKKTQRTKRWVKHWFVLKNDALSWYESSSDPYFPHGVVDLRYAISCEAIHDKGIRLRTNQKTVTLHADSVPSREEWVKSIRKVIFKAQNMGESVKIAIPYSAILDVDKSSAMDFSETIEVKVVDKEENYSMDSYFFAYFRDIGHALEEIRGAVRTYHHSPSASASPGVKDTTAQRLATAALLHERAHSLPSLDHKIGSGFKFSSLLRPFSSSSEPTIAGTKPNQPHDGFTNIQTVAPQSAISLPTKVPSRLSTVSDPRESSPSAVCNTTYIDHTYPPPPSPMSSMHEARPSSSWSVPVPSWLRPRSLFSSSSQTTPGSSHGEVSEVFSSLSSSHFQGESGEMGFSVLDANEDPHSPAHPTIVEKYRASFALDEKEMLLGYYSGYLFRVLPVYGRLYISTNFFCFRSSQVLTKTRMMIPIRDILATEKSRAFRFTHYGLIVVIKGHEEIFLEFGTAERRDACMKLLEQQMEDYRRRSHSGEVIPPSKGKRDALILEELEPSGILQESDPVPPPEALSESLPAVMFTSASSTFLTFKPETSLHFTCLTIGSRGDVQPYIALCKGLKADGHRVRIATHLEFKDWVEGHGIEFGYVGGDPAELMRICVENGTFTVSFLKEGVQKFRGWIDDLLKTAFLACQGTDVLIESPSAMAGIHIAEALRIPYFRAFTMPWTRTRAYPQAFAVPEHKMGGGYNYMSYVMFDQVFWHATAGQINRWRRNVLGLESTNLDKLEPHKVPFLYNFSPSIVPPPLDWYEWIRVTGYWFLDEPDDSTAKKWSPPEDLVAFIDSAHRADKKVVYIGFGSIVVSDPEAMTKCIVEAVQESGVHAILSKGWSDRLSNKKPGAHEADQPTFPPTIYSIATVPHDWLFQRIDAACHHGGAGTTGASLRAGIPTIIKPFFGDQFFWADRVEALGIGTGVRKLTVDHLAEALRVATTDIKQIDRAKMVGNSIRGENGIKTAIEAIYRDLEYARSLIKKPTSHLDSDHDADYTPQPKSPALEWRKELGPERNWESISNGAPPSEDWSVIDEDHAAGDNEQTQSSLSPKRGSLVEAVSDALSYRSARS